MRGVGQKRHDHDADVAPAPEGSEHRHHDSGAAAQPSPETFKAGAEAMASSKHHPLPLRIFFLIVSLGLFTSTITGLYMSYVYVRNKVLITVTLIAGIVIPLALVFV